MTRTISQRELRNESGAILRALDRGEDFLITRNGVAVGELRPARRPFVPLEVLLQAFRHAPPIDPVRFRADIDGILDQNIDPAS